MKCPQCGKEERYYAITFGTREFRWCKDCGYHANPVIINGVDLGVDCSNRLDLTPISDAIRRLGNAFSSLASSTEGVAKLQRACNYSTMLKVFDDFHTGQRTKSEVAMAIGLWQRQDPPNAPALIDKVEEYWKRYAEYFHRKAVEACRTSSKKHRRQRWKYSLYMRLYGGRP